MKGMLMGVLRILSSGNAEPSTGEQNGTFNGTFLTCMVKGDVGSSLVSKFSTKNPRSHQARQHSAPDRAHTVGALDGHPSIPVAVSFCGNELFPCWRGWARAAPSGSGGSPHKESPQRWCNVGPLLTSAAEPAAVARFVEGAAGAAHRSKSSHLAQPLTGVDAMLTANLAAEVSPTI